MKARAGYMAIKTALLDIGEDDQQIGTTRHEAKSLASSMDTVETALVSVLWNVILARYNETNLKFVHFTCDSTVGPYSMGLKIDAALAGGPKISHSGFKLLYFYLIRQPCNFTMPSLSTPHC